METSSTKAGTLDPTFGDGGKVIIRFGDSIALARNLAIGSDDSIFVALTVPGTDISIGSSFGLAKLHADGRIDYRFGVEGYAVYPGPGGSIEIEDRQVQEPALTIGIGADGLEPFVLPSGKILLLCTTSAPIAGVDEIPFLAQFNVEGTLDDTFGENGKRYFDFEDHRILHATVMPMQDGKIVMACRRVNAAGAIDGLIMRLTENGENDTSFGDAGIQPVAFPGGMDGSTACAVAQGTDFVVGGNNDLQGLVRRFLPDGRIDVTFGKEGTYHLPDHEDADSDHPVFEQMLLTPGDDLVGIGTARVLRGAEKWRQLGFVVGIGRDGRPNPDFGNGEPVLIPEHLGESSLHRGLVDGAGRLVVAGAPGGSFPKGFLAARYSISGVPDASFGSEGVQVVLLGESNEIASGLAVQRSGKVLLSGQVIDGSTTWRSNGVVMRLLDA